ncbi:YbaN family protein [Salipiger sp. PrR002]|uniref:YbaN family protein n=1 Tax=Salipiger sp. PrR002 TaxID=2706489 RepID=UPI001940B40B|nr:YbaN family protein [Salipiger sp. PrR002]
MTKSDPHLHPPRTATGGLRLLWLALGSISLVTGIVGIVLPVLPTTPLVLLAAFAFSRSSPRLHDYLQSHPRFGPMIADWRANGAIAPRHKAMAVGMMSAAFLLSVYLDLPGRVLLIQLVCMGGAAIFVLSRPNGPGRRPRV